MHVCVCVWGRGGTPGHLLTNPHGKNFPRAVFKFTKPNRLVGLLLSFTVPSLQTTNKASPGEVSDLVKGKHEDWRIKDTTISDGKKGTKCTLIQQSCLNSFGNI